jgi:hypothetical protein
MTLSSTPWIEAYRPKSLSQVSSQEETVQMLKKTLESRNVLYSSLNTLSSPTVSSMGLPGLAKRPQSWLSPGNCTGERFLSLNQ